MSCYILYQNENYWRVILGELVYLMRYFTSILHSNFLAHYTFNSHTNEAISYSLIGFLIEMAMMSFLCDFCAIWAWNSPLASCICLIEKDLWFLFFCNLCEYLMISLLFLCWWALCSSALLAVLTIFSCTASFLTFWTMTQLVDNSLSLTWEIRASYCSDFFSVSKRSVEVS